jgi:hypothetical protein
LKGKRAHKLFKNLLRGEGIRLVSLFWKKKIVERWKWKMGWVWGFIFKALIVDGGKGHGLYFFTFLIFRFVIFGIFYF